MILKFIGLEMLKNQSTIPLGLVLTLIYSEIMCIRNYVLQ